MTNKRRDAIKKHAGKAADVGVGLITNSGLTPDEMLVVTSSVADVANICGGMKVKELNMFIKVIENLFSSFENAVATGVIRE